jgi:hypothetical protein
VDCGNPGPRGQCTAGGFLDDGEERPETIHASRSDNSGAEAAMISGHLAGECIKPAAKQTDTTPKCGSASRDGHVEKKS